MHLNLRDSGLDGEGSLFVMEAIMNTKLQLEFLDLSGSFSIFCGIFTVIFAFIVNIHIFQQLTIFLKGNDITADQCEIFAKLLNHSCMSQLKEIALDDNEIESTGIILIAESIIQSAKSHHLSHLESISVNCCEIASAGAFALAR